MTVFIQGLKDCGPQNIHFAFLRISKSFMSLWINISSDYRLFFSKTVTNNPFILLQQLVIPVRRLGKNYIFS